MIDKEELENAINESQERYNTALKNYKSEVKNFYGMNEDKPKKSQALIIHEAAQCLLVIIHDLEEIIEARGKATPDAESYLDSQFITTTANAVERISKVVIKFMRD